MSNCQIMQPRIFCGSARYFFFWFLKRVSPNLFSRFPLTSLKLLPLPLVRAMCEICHFNEPTLRTECSCMQPFSPPLPTHHATKVLSSGSCTTNQHQHHPPIYHLTALVVVGAVAWTKLNPASGAWPSEGETLRKSLI